MGVVGTVSVLGVGVTVGATVAAGGVFLLGAPQRSDSIVVMFLFAFFFCCVSLCGKERVARIGEVCVKCSKDYK